MTSETRDGLTPRAGRLGALLLQPPCSLGRPGRAGLHPRRLNSCLAALSEGRSGGELQNAGRVVKKRGLHRLCTFACGFPAAPKGCPVAADPSLCPLDSSRRCSLLGLWALSPQALPSAGQQRPRGHLAARRAQVCAGPASPPPRGPGPENRRPESRPPALAPRPLGPVATSRPGVLRGPRGIWPPLALPSSAGAVCFGGQRQTEG